MSNVFFNGLTCSVSSGTTLGVYAPIDRVQSIKVDFQVPRANEMNLGRFAPLVNRPVINYTPVNLNIEYIKADKNVETCLGLLNSTGLAIQIGNGTQVTDWGCRTYPVVLAPIQSQINMGEYDVVSGVLKSFRLQGAINDVVKGSFAVEGLDLRQKANNNIQSVVPTYSGSVVRSQDVTITGIDFTGLGYSGLIITSFSFGAAFGYSAQMRLGDQYPTRRMVEGNATLNLDAYIDGTTNTATGLAIYTPGSYLSGTYVFTLAPSCAGNQSPTTITLKNPYLENQSLGLTVGSFVNVSLGFSVPLTIVAEEARSGPNVTIT